MCMNSGDTILNYELSIVSPELLYMTHARDSVNIRAR